MRYGIEQTHQDIDTDEARALRLLGQLPGRILTPGLVAAVCATDHTRAGVLLTGFMAAGLVQDLRTHQERDAGLAVTCALYDAVAANARRWAQDTESPADRETALRRWVEWYLLAATAAEGRLSPDHRTMPRTPRLIIAVPGPGLFDQVSEQEVVEWLERHRSDLLVAIAAAHAAGWVDLAWQLTDATQPLWVRRRHLDDWISVHTLHGLPAAEQDGQPRAVRRMLTTLAAGLCSAGVHDQALARYQQAANLARSAGDQRDLARSLHGIGDAHHQGGHRDDAALPPLNQALTISEAIRDTHGAALTRILLGNIAAGRRDWFTAHTFLARARAGLLTAPDPYNAARALAFLGRARARCGYYDAGIGELEQAHHEFGETGAHHWSARTQEWRGEAARDQHRMEDARLWFTAARTRYAALHSLPDVKRLDEQLNGLNE